MRALVGARLLAEGEWLDDHALVIDGDRIEAIVPISQLPRSTARHELPGGTLLPGFIDTQVNGGGGVLLNDAPTRDGIRAIAEAHRRFGTTALLPTLISDDLSVIAAAIAAVDEAIAVGVPGVIGIHLEGPFLNADKRGIHDHRKFRSLDAEAIALLCSLENGKTLVTLAPELAPSGAIAQLVARGVVVAAGHTLATYEQMQSAFAEGLSGVTHLFNAMTQLTSRAPGVVGAALERGTAGVIVDGHHVAPLTLRVALAARGADGLMLVTDAMPCVGSDRRSFRIGEHHITVVDGVPRGPDGTLAGSALDMASAVRNSIAMMNVSLATASHMASGVPAAFLGMHAVRGTLAKGLAADIVHVDDMLRVTTSWIAGSASQR